MALRPRPALCPHQGFGNEPPGGATSRSVCAAVDVAQGSKLGRELVGPDDMLNGVQDPSGDPPPLVWPSFLRPTPPFQLVYLDLNHWISLAQAATGHSDGARFVQVLAACREARRAGVAIFPLSNSHYVEISKIKDPRQRQDLAHVIEELSDFITLLSPAALKKIELDAVLQEPLGSLPSRWNNYPLVGYGVGFSLGRPMRPQLVGRDGEDVTEQWRQLPGGDELLRDAAVGLERAVLAGPTDAEVPQLRADGWDPEAAWGVAESRAQEEREQALRIDGATGKNWRKGRLRDMMCARETLIELREAFEATFKERGNTSLDLWFSDRDKMRRLVRSMPSSEVAIELKTAMHRNAQRACVWEPNDVVDMDALSLAVPYCDIVVTEQHAHHVLRAARLHERMDTVLLRDLTELPANLSA